MDPHPTLWIEAPSEPELLVALSKVGPLPQADLFEPWDPTDPWRARARVPHVDPARCLAVGELHHGEAPGRQEWIDCGRIGEDHIELDGHVARCLFDHEGGLLFPDLVELDTPVDAQLAAFSRGIGGRSPVWVQAVRHRDTGRPGLRFTAQVPDLDPVAERHAVLQAVLGCGEPLCTDLLWWFELSRVVIVAWRVHPPLDALPPDAGFGYSGPLDGWQGAIELQVRLDPASHDTDALALAEQLGEHGFVGSRPRWIGPDFVACWELADGDPLELAIPHRTVPGCPVGLEQRWPGIDPRWYPGHLVRYRCGLADKDLLPRCTPREPDPIDHALVALFGGFAQLDPVQADVPALRLVFPTLTTRHWALWVERFAQVQHPELATVHYVAMADQTTVLLRRRGEVLPDRW